MTQAEFFDDKRFAPEPGVSRGNAADFTALGALASGLLTLFLCLSCGTGLWCLPALPVGLGVAGLLMAKRAVGEERSRRWSVIGLVAGMAVVAFLVLAMIGAVAIALLTNSPSGN
ncbi:MAG: hypothetical protein JXA21_21305 [Anaerolineae bacterium]|nr:hypothetical protein [Anaerolineae bacterium]